MTGIDSGTVYINYLGNLEDDNGKQMERIVDSSMDMRFRSAFGLKATLITAIG